MSTIAAFFLLSLAAVLLDALQSTCRNLITCPCGQTGKSITICLESQNIADDICNEWIGCKSCRDGLFQCLECADGFKGRECTKILTQENPRQKSQIAAYRSRRLNSSRSSALSPEPSAHNSGRSVAKQSNPPTGSVYELLDVGYLQTRRVARQASSEGINVCTDPGIVLHSSVTVVLPPYSPRTTSRTDQDYPVGTQLRYTCEEGLVLLGSSTITCESEEVWSPDPPVCSIDCGISAVQTEEILGDRLFNAIKTKPGEWPWVVAIAVRNRGSLEIVCGGALINSRTVLTAAHCLDANSVTLYFGKVHRWDRNDDNEVEVRQSTEIIRHRDYSSNTYDNDIALIKFVPRVRFTERIQPICLPSKETMARHLMTGENGVVTGWGENEHGLPADELMKVHLPVLTNEECMESYRIQNIDMPLTDNMFCTGFGANQQTTCSGDSGSPLVFKDMETGRYSVEGIVSFGVTGQCGQEGRYPVFTKVGRYASWIRRNERGGGSGRWRDE